MNKIPTAREVNDPKPIAVIFGGRGKEREISKRSGIAFIRQMASLGYAVLPIFVDPEGRLLLYEGEPTEISEDALSRLKVEAWPVYLSGKSGFLSAGDIIPVRCAAIIMHGDGGEDGSVQGALETARIDYIGSGVGASAISLDKYAAKCIARELGIPVLDFRAYRLGDESPEQIKKRIEGDLGYPVFIKPRSLGSSIGASAAFSGEELISALKAAKTVTDDIIAERCLADKRELEVAYYALGDTVGATDPAEVDLGGGFYSFSEKYSQKSRARLSVRADVSSEISARLREYTVRLSRVIGIRHFARLDYFLSGDNVYFSEVNTIPGMTEKSLFLSMLRDGGIGFAELASSLFGGYACE